MTIDRQWIDNTITVLCREFPNCFVLFERRRRPLKLGIRVTISSRPSDQIDRKLPRPGAAALHRKFTLQDVAESRRFAH